MQNKRAILFANGKVKSLLHVRKMMGADDTLIAVDGGYKLFRNLDLVPHFLIGDLDSISARDVREARYRGIEIIKYPTATKIPETPAQKMRSLEYSIFDSMFFSPFYKIKNRFSRYRSTSAVILPKGIKIIVYCVPAIKSACALAAQPIQPGILLIKHLNLIKYHDFG